MQGSCFSITTRSFLFSLAAVVSVSAAPSGAIFTTLGDGSAVNANHFESKCAVHLDGGPGPNAPAHAAGLPNGDYYFQVTDASGRHLLSTDPVSNRRFRVANGVIVAYTGTGGLVHPTGIDRDHPELGAVTIRLANTSCPADFLDSPNAGGVYKVWATPVNDFVGNPAQVDNECGNGCFHGFVPSKSKTDNFKAKSGTPTFCLTVNKEFFQGDGSYLPTPNWQFKVTDPLGVTNSYFTNTAGTVQVCGLAEGAYSVFEELPPYVAIFELIVNGAQVPSDTVYSFTWTTTKAPPVITFRNGNNSPPE
jgi:hypothetical protein